MPNHLDLALSPARANRLLNNSNPRMTLRRNRPSYDNGPLSATSSRFSFNHLLASPPPSPSLPALVPRHGKAPPSPTPRRVRRMGRLLLCLTTVCAVAYLASTLLPLRRSSAAAPGPSALELIGDDALPDFPTPVVVTDAHGRPRWTVSIPPAHAFPLAPAEYADLCAQTTDIAAHVAGMHGHAPPRPHSSDAHFLDAPDAEAAGVLSNPPSSATHPHHRSLVGPSAPADAPPCSRTLTLLLETPSAGLGATLLLLWTAYAHALASNRAFFIDDSRWAYGSYTDFFLPLPPPACRPPPRHHLLPCPASARHLLVSAATASHVFPAAAGSEEENRALARVGHDALFRLAPADAAYVDARVKAIKQQAADAAATVVGVHVRRGDRRPRERMYADSYVPLDRYASAAAAAGGQGTGQPLVLIASDDPDVYEADEFAGAQRAQERIRLAGKAAVAPTAVPGGEVGEAPVGLRRFVEEAVGWEGGFYAGMFWSLGGEEEGEERRLRGLVGRAYLLDLAVLGGASGGVVCGGASAGCRVLGVMVQGGWTDVDEGRGWWGLDAEES